MILIRVILHVPKNNIKLNKIDAKIRRILNIFNFVISFYYFTFIVYYFLCYFL